MAHTSSCLSLPKEALYNGFLIFKLFAASEEKSAMTLKNSRIFALTSLLISSKMDSMYGNFLLATDKIVDGSSQIKKEELIEY